MVEYSTRTVTSPSIRFFSSKSARAALEPPSVFSMTIAFMRKLVASGGCSRKTSGRLLDDRQIDERAHHAEEHRKPPHRVVGAGPFEHDAAQERAEEPADLMAEEGKAIEHREPARAEHQSDEARSRRHGRQP